MGERLLLEPGAVTRSRSLRGAGGGRRVGLGHARERISQEKHAL